MPIDEFCGYLVQLMLAGDLDVVEIFGGVGGVGGFVLRRMFKSGDNFGLVTGFDLCKVSRQRYVFDYLEAHNFLVVALAPPCISFGQWASLNRVVHPEIWRESRFVGELFAAFCSPHSQNTIGFRETFFAR